MSRISEFFISTKAVWKVTRKRKESHTQKLIGVPGTQVIHPGSSVARGESWNAKAREAHWSGNFKNHFVGSPFNFVIPRGRFNPQPPGPKPFPSQTGKVLSGSCPDGKGQLPGHKGAGTWLSFLRDRRPVRLQNWRLRWRLLDDNDVT